MNTRRRSIGKRFTIVSGTALARYRFDGDSKLSLKFTAESLLGDQKRLNLVRGTPAHPIPSRWSDGEPDS